MNIIFGHSHGFHLLREEWSEFTRNLPQRDSHLCAVCEKNYISYNNKKNENIYMAYIYIYTANPGLLPRSRNNDYAPYDNNDTNNDNKKKHINTYLYICICVCEIPHTEYAPHIHIDIIPRVYLSIYTFVILINLFIY